MLLTKKTAYTLIFVFSLIALVLSLYYGYYGDIAKNIQDGILFDTSRGIAPCALCRYIRIAQYPITLISGIALLKKEYKQSYLYIIVLSIVGLLFSAYKVLLEQGILGGGTTGVCGLTPSVSCGTPTYLLGTGISLAASGVILFIVIIGLLLVSKKLQGKSN